MKRFQRMTMCLQLVGWLPYWRVWQRRSWQWRTGSILFPIQRPIRSPSGLPGVASTWRVRCSLAIDSSRTRRSRQLFLAAAQLP